MTIFFLFFLFRGNLLKYKKRKEKIFLRRNQLESCLDECTLMSSRTIKYNFNRSN